MPPLIRREYHDNAYWVTNNPILAAGVQGFDTTSHQYRIGDGVTRYLSLAAHPAPNFGFGDSGWYGPGSDGLPLPTGGDAGEFLVKSSSADGDADWRLVDASDVQNAPWIVATDPGPDTLYRTKGLDNWYSTALAIPNQRAKILWIGDSISVLSNFGGYPAPWLVARQLGLRAASVPQSVLGTRFTDPAATSTPRVDTSEGTTHTEGASGYCASFTSGQKLTVSGLHRTIRVVYTEGPDAGDILISAGGGTLDTITATAPAVGFSRVYEYSFGSTAQRTVTLTVSGGTSTVIELVSMLGPEVVSDTGVDMMVCGHSGYNTAHFLPADDPNADNAWGDPSSHALALVEQWQPDLVVNNIGYNDATAQDYLDRQRSLVRACLDLAPQCTVLTVVPYNGAGNALSASYEIAAHLIRDELDGTADEGRVGVVSYYRSMGDVSSGNDLMDYSWDGAHPTGNGKAIQAAIVTSALTGDPFGTTLASLMRLIQNAGITWHGPSTGIHNGRATSPVVTVSGAKTLDPSDYGSTLVYNGSSPITLMIGTTNLVAALTGYDQWVTKIIQGGSGAVTVAGDGVPNLIGPTATTGQGDTLTITTAGALGVNVICSLA